MIGFPRLGQGYGRIEAIWDVPMARCDVCDNDYDKAFTVSLHDGTQGTFDSFECAIHALAPRCEHCGCAVIGHGVESNGTIFCCASCARNAGAAGLRDRAAGDEGAAREREGIAPTRPPSES